jgi:hypothetical protein
LFCHKEFCIFASQVGAIIFLFRRDGQGGLVGQTCEVRCLIVKEHGSSRQGRGWLRLA